MRVMATRSLLFTRGEEEVKIKHHEIKDVPDWVAETMLFKLAQKDNTIQVIENKLQQKEAENSKPATNKKPATKESPAEEK
ncbi:hypothetical protein EUAN_08620 [Andreesenia angusta]|uniref:Uncharacterized protein n=1 Tax=Andreesenia angusta TaxID=39480 RepID=A0A1S1V907_9FIRM|nr:hypothetical protein [Andreesenia angusta]OHW63078.1 hypothetical protein EUAN_08620 [Andreesenia angusta]